MLLGRGGWASAGRGCASRLSRVAAVTMRSAAHRPARVGAHARFSSTPASEGLVGKVKKLAPGVLTAGSVMYMGFELADVLGKAMLSAQGVDPEKAQGSPISGVPIAILLGLALKNNPVFALPSALGAGLTFCTKPILQAGIICVGAKLSVLDVMKLGVLGVPAVLACIGTGLGFTMWFGRVMGLPHRMSSLIAAGTSICGVTAITALAPAIAATQAETAVAVANVVAFGTTSMICYPWLVHNVLPLNHSETKGLFLGLAVHDTSQVMGSALSYQGMYNDDDVIKWATVTKLTRNIFLAAVIPTLTYMTAKAAAAAAATEAASKSVAAAAAVAAAPAGGMMASLAKHTPAFIFGFMGMSVLRSIGDATLASSKSGDGSEGGVARAFGVLDEDTWKDLTKAIPAFGTKYLLGTAMAAVGLSTSASVFKGVGIRPFVVGMSACGVVGCTAVASAVFMEKLGVFIDDEKQRPQTDVE